jgi:hypothetical protein
LEMLEIVERSSKGLDRCSTFAPNRSRV